MEIGDRSRKTVDGKVSTSDYTAFKQTFEVIMQFMSEYKKSSHDKDESSSQTPQEPMAIDGEKNSIICRCALASVPKEVLRGFTPVTHSSIKTFRFLPIQQLRNSLQRWHPSYVSSGFGCLLRVVRFPGVNRTRPSRFKNGDSRNLSHS